MKTEIEPSSEKNALIELPKNVWTSVFRHPVPASEMGQAQTSFTNFFLHIHPVKVNRNTLRPLYTMGLGLISFFMFVILTVSGLLLITLTVPRTCVSSTMMKPAASLK